VSKYTVRCRKPPSQTWRTFLENHAKQLVSIDFFTVPTIGFKVLTCFWCWLMTGVEFCFNVTAHPTAEWTGQQLREAFPFDQLPRYRLRDRDAIFGSDFRAQLRDMGISEVLSAPRSPWQRAYVERVIGSIRRECLDHVITFDAGSLRRTLNSYFDYYHRPRTHLSLGKDSPEPVIGPYSYSSVDATLSQTLFSVESIQRFRAARTAEQAALLNYQDITGARGALHDFDNVTHNVAQSSHA